MNKLILFMILIIFSACSQKLQLDANIKVVEKNKKLFAEEDSLIMFALRAEQVQDFKSAAKIFEKLYEKSLRKEYIHRSLQNRLFLKENKFVIGKVDEIVGTSKDDFILIRLKIIALIQDSKLKNAQDEAIKLVELTKDESDYILVSDILGAQQKFDEAVKYLESGYSQNYSEKILDKMSIILYVNLNRKKDALAYLETHVMLHSCSVLICKRLISFYSNDNNIEGLLSTSLRYYKLKADTKIAAQIVQLYRFKKEYPKLILFLEGSDSDDLTLLELYISSKNYTKAHLLARRMYEDTGNVKYLGESVIYEYESQKNKNDKAFLNKISKKFEEVIEQDSSSLYLNYYGYLLIDHDIDIDKGMEYVKKALLEEPESSYYLDSLAWGYYKKNECAKALDIIKKVRTLEGGDDPEVIKHHKKIKKCKGKKK